MDPRCSGYNNHIRLVNFESYLRNLEKGKLIPYTWCKFVKEFLNYYSDYIHFTERNIVVNYVPPLSKSYQLKANQIV